MKNLFLLSLLFLFNSLYSQNKENNIKANAFEIKSNSKKELQDFDWKEVKKFFKENDKQDYIKLVINYNASTNNSANDVSINSLKAEIKGQTYELNKMIRAAKKITRKLLKSKSV